MISGATIAENNKLTANGGLKVSSGNTIFNDPLTANTLEVTKTTKSKKFNVKNGGISITGASKSGSLSSSNDVTVSANSNIENILDIDSEYPSLSTGSLGTDANKTDLNTNTLKVTGTSEFNDDILINGNLTADSITLTNAEISATSPEIDSSWLENIPTTAITPASANPTTYSKSSRSSAKVSSTIAVENNIKFTKMTVGTTFNPTILDETYTGTTGGSVTTNVPVTTDTLKLSEWTDNTNFISDKTSYTFRDAKDSNVSNLTWSSSDGYKLYATVLDETDNSAVNQYIAFAEKGSNGYEFIEDDTVGCKIDMSTDTTEIHLGGEFIEEFVKFYDPATYITTFVPEITYSTTTGFTVTNFSTLLADTNTTVSDWEVGLLKYHYRRNTGSTYSRRHFRTSWNGIHSPGTMYSQNYQTIRELTFDIDNSGVVTNTEDVYKYNPSWNDYYHGQTWMYLGIRIRHKNSKNRSLYPSRMLIGNASGNISYKDTSEIMALLDSYK